MNALLSSDSPNKEGIGTQLKTLPESMRNSIYGKIFELSSASSKGGDGWGEIHATDDLGVLAAAVSEVLFPSN